MRATFASLLSALAKRTLAVSDESAFMKDTKMSFVNAKKSKYQSLCQGECS